MANSSPPRRAISPCARVEQRLEARSDQLEQLVASKMPKRVVDLLEAVEVHQQQCEPLAVGRRLGDARAELLGEPLAVRQAGEWVVPRLMLERGERVLASA